VLLQSKENVIFVRNFSKEKIMMENRRVKSKSTLVRFKIKTYKPEEIMASGGASVFSAMTKKQYNTHKALKSLSEIALSEEEVATAIQEIRATK
jgi:hypothetical protein